MGEPAGREDVSSNSRQSFGSEGGYENDEGDESDDDDDDGDDGEEVVTGAGVKIPEFRMDEKAFNLLEEKLSGQIRNYKLKFELVDGTVYVRTVPGLAHGLTVGTFRGIMRDYSENPNSRTPSNQPLIDSDDSSIFPLFPS